MIYEVAYKGRVPGIPFNDSWKKYIRQTLRKLECKVSFTEESIIVDAKDKNGLAEACIFIGYSMGMYDNGY